MEEMTFLQRTAPRAHAQQFGSRHQQNGGHRGSQQFGLRAKRRLKNLKRFEMMNAEEMQLVDRDGAELEMTNLNINGSAMNNIIDHQHNDGDGDDNVSDGNVTVSG